MRASKALSMKRTSESMRSHSSTAAEDGAQSDEDTGGENSALSNKPVSSPISSVSADDQIDKLIPGRLRDFGGEFSSSAFGVWAEREWILRASGNRVHLDAVDFDGRQFQTYQWFTGESESDIPTCCVFCPPLIPLQPPSSLHECRSLESTGTFAISWMRTTTNVQEQHYIRVYDPEDSPIVGLCQDRRWASKIQLTCRDRIVSMALSPGGSHLIAGGGHGMQLWNLSMEEEIWSVIGDEDCPGGIAHVAFSPDGRLFASVAPNSKMVRLWWRSESAGHGGFAFLLLPHGNQVQKFVWRPRSSSSSYGTAQSILTQTVAGTIRIWQESDHLEDFDFYTVCEINACSPTSLVSWIEYYADYDGLLWPPESSFRKSRAFGTFASTEEDQGSKKSKGYSSKRLWGTLDRGHGHAWFGEAAYDNLESRLGSFSSSSSMRDWIVSIDEGKIIIWAVEGLGEHARTSIRCEIWIQRRIELGMNARIGLAFCRFLVPVCHEGQPMPRCDELYADNVPSNLRLCFESSTGAMGIVSIGFDVQNEISTRLDATQANDEQVKVQSSFFHPHLSNQIILLARSSRGELITADKSCRVVWWSNENKPVRTIDVNYQVHYACFMELNHTKSIVTINEETGAASMHDHTTSRTFGLSFSSELGKIVGVCGVNSILIIIKEHGIMTWEVSNLRNISANVSGDVLVRFRSKSVTAMCISADGSSLWTGFEDGSLRRFDLTAKANDRDTEEQMEPNGNNQLNESHTKSPSSKLHEGAWKVKKIQAAGMWIARMMESAATGERLVAMTSLASASLTNEFEEENLAQRVGGLAHGGQKGSTTAVVDIAFCEFGQSLVCGLAVLINNGSVKIASRVKDRWVVIAQSQSMETPYSKLSPTSKWQSVAWLDKGRLIALDDSSVLEFSGWTCPGSTNLPWTFSGGLNVSGWGSVDDQGRSRNGLASTNTKRAMLRRANSSSRMMLKDEDLGINEAMGNIGWLCAQSQLSLPAHHPRSLLEDLRQGQLSRVEKVLKHLAKAAEEHPGGPSHALVVPPLDPGPSSSDFHLSRGKSGATNSSSTLTNSAQNQTAAALFGSSFSLPSQGSQTAAALFATPASSYLQNQTAANLFAASSLNLASEKVVGEEEDENAESEENWLESLESKLPTLKISGLSPSDHLALLSCVSLFRRLSDDKISGLDPAGSRFALAVETLKLNTRGMMASDSLRTCDVIWAMHSDAQTSLIKNFLEHPNLVWDECRAIGAAFWVTNPDDIKSLTERLAKSHFIKYERDPFRCLLFYCALNKPRICSALFKAAKNDKVAQLLAQDFTQERWKIAASKNGYALVEKKRYEEAAGFFLLADKHSEAIRVLSRSLEDSQLALFVAKIIACVNPQEGPRVLDEFLNNIYMEVGRATKDPWLCSMIYSILNKPQEAIRCFSTDFFDSLNAKEEISKSDLERRRERFVWLRQLASRDKPKICGFDPIAIAFIQHVLSRPPLLYSKSDELDHLLASNRQRAILFYLSEGLPRLAEDLLNQESSPAYDRFKSQARLSAALPGMVSKGGSEVNSSGTAGAEHNKLLQATRELNLVRSFLGSLEANSVTLAREVEDVVDKKIALAFKGLAIGGMASSRVSARRLACYSLCLNEQIPRLTSPVKELASLACFGGLVLSAMLLKQTNLVDSFFSCGPFEPGSQVRTAISAGGLRLLRDYVDYEETLRGRPTTSDSGGNWAANLARSVLRLAIFEDLLQQFSSTSSSLSGSFDEKECLNSLLVSIGSLVRRLRSDVHYLAGLPDFASSPFSTLVDPLRPYLSTTRSFEDFNEQALWTRFQGPERMLKLVGELAHSFRFRNKRPYLPAHSSISKHKMTAVAGSTPEAMMKRGPLTTIVLYQSPGEYLCGISLSQAFPNYMVVGLAERGSRDVNIKSSLRYRNRTPDGRGLTDAEKETWSEVYRRFAEQERFDSDDGWELYLSASATGMKQRHAEVPLTLNKTNSPGALGRVRQAERVQRAGSFLPFSLQRMRLALDRFVDQQKNTGLPQHNLQGGYELSRDDPITRLAAHSSLPLFASAGHDGSACLWHVGEPRPVCKLPRPLSYSGKSPVTRLRISPDGYRVVAGDGAGRCAIWQVDLGESQPFLNIACAPSNRAINDIAYLNLSSVFATCSADGVVNLWDTLLPPRSCCVATWYNPVPASNTNIPVSNGPAQLGLSSLAFSPQTRCLFTGNERGSIYSIDVRQCRTAVEARQVHQKPITSLAISPDGYTIGSGSMDGNLKLFSLDDLSAIASVSNVHPYSFTHHQAVTEIVFAPNGSMFSCGADGTVKITYSSEAVM